MRVPDRPRLLGPIVAGATSGPAYPHRPMPATAPAGPVPPRIEAQDVERALAELGDTLNVDPADLRRLLERADAHATQRQRRPAGR